MTYSGRCWQRQVREERSKVKRKGQSGRQKYRLSGELLMTGKALYRAHHLRRRSSCYYFLSQRGRLWNQLHLLVRLYVSSSWTSTGRNSATYFGDIKFLSVACQSEHAERGHVLGQHHLQINSCNRVLQLKKLMSFLSCSLLQIFIEYSTKPEVDK